MKISRMPQHTPPRGIFFLGKMKILGKKMVFTAEKRGVGVCVLLIRRSQSNPCLA
jgi:hypothetical protein